MATDKVEEVGSSIGLKVSYNKRKVLSVGGQQSFIPVSLRGQHLEDVDDFVYLGSIIHESSNVDAELRRRLALAAFAFAKLSNVWQN